MKPKTNLPYALEYRYYNLPVDFPIFALLGSRWMLPDDDITFLHFHNCLEIGYCYEGSGYLLVEDQKLDFSAGDISVVYQNTVHRSASTKGTRSWWEYLYIDTERILADFFPGGFPHHEFFLLQTLGLNNIIKKGQNPFIHMLVKNILEEMRLEKDNYKDCVRGLCLSLFIELIRENSQNETDSFQSSHLYLSIMPAISHIDKNYMLPLKIQELADLCQMSPTHFRRLFQASMHTSPLEYLNRVRIRRSCILLHNTEKSILEISLEVGFSSISSYNRQFQRVIGTSPLRWRNNSRSMHKKDYAYSVFDF
ncbi:MAG: AraC family transcriptional regulator [Eubacteriales bacterium]|nr:AraC family transcriptional regulator [Eubacteriales bacterium]